MAQNEDKTTPVASSGSATGQRTAADVEPPEGTSPEAEARAEAEKEAAKAAKQAKKDGLTNWHDEPQVTPPPPASQAYGNFAPTPKYEVADEDKENGDPLKGTLPGTLPGDPESPNVGRHIPGPQDVHEDPDPLSTFRTVPNR